jgi:hypothetical protein
VQVGAAAGDVVLVRVYSSRRTARGSRRCAHGPGEIDALAAYCPELDRCFYLPVDRLSGRLQVCLRVAPSRNNQGAGVNWADDFDFDGLQSLTLGP